MLVHTRVAPKHADAGLRRGLMLFEAQNACLFQKICMPPSSIFEFVKEARDNYRSQIVQVADGYDFSQ